MIKHISVFFTLQDSFHGVNVQPSGITWLEPLLSVQRQEITGFEMWLTPNFISLEKHFFQFTCS